MYNRLIHYINENKLLYKYQFGFRAGKYTHMALIVLLDKISEALERGECVMGVFLDKDLWHCRSFNPTKENA